MKAYQHLEDTFRQLSYLSYAKKICLWDEAVMMPVGASQARAEALSYLDTIERTQLVNHRVKKWLMAAKEAPLISPWQQANLKWMEIIYLRVSAIPNELLRRSRLATIRCEHAWRTMRAGNNWREFLPFLEENIASVKEIANIWGSVFNLDPYDSLLHYYSPGLSQAIIEPIFLELKKQLPVIMQKVMAKQQPGFDLTGVFPIEKQKQLALLLMRAIGFDFDHGRLDESHHPFCSGIPEDVRITNRYVENEFINGAFGVCHETGHALYVRNLPSEWRRQPVGELLNMSLHEAQALILEMQACRSREFMQFFSPLVREFFGELPQFSADNLYRQFIKVQPGLIRVDADEVCYPLHVILRYELEKKLINGEIVAKDLPELWDNAMQSFFGLSTKDNYRDGVMQDFQWSHGEFGYFPAYNMATIIAAQLFHAAKKAHPDILANIAQGDFSKLVNWLRINVYSLGRSMDMPDLIAQATGQPLSVDFFLNHLTDRYLA